MCNLGINGFHIESYGPLFKKSSPSQQCKKKPTKNCVFYRFFNRCCDLTRKKKNPSKHHLFSSRNRKPRFFHTYYYYILFAKKTQLSEADNWKKKELVVLLKHRRQRKKRTKLQFSFWSDHFSSMFQQVIDEELKKRKKHFSG